MTPHRPITSSEVVPKGDAPAPANDAVPRRRRAKRLEREPLVRGSLPVPKTILPWERELLLPIAVEALTDFVEANEHETPDIDKERK